ncbi:epoxide hydrolase [Diplocarpon rosae]|nr:epoxide hydrolase [Diplocarpon rosae]
MQAILDYELAHSIPPGWWIYPALQRLKASGQYILAALSNTVVFPPDHPYANPPPDKDIRAWFDVFVSSAHVGYVLFPRTQLLRMADEVVFLDDIGENLKAAKALAFRTIKVPLGRSFEAVDELERVTGLSLAGTHPRVPITVPPERTRAGAKL